MNTRLIRFATLMALIAFSSAACANNEPPEPIFEKVLPNDAAVSLANFKPHSMRYTKAEWAMHYSMKQAVQDGKTSWLVEVEFNPGPDSKPDQIWLDNSTMAFRRRLLRLKDYTIDVSMNEGLFSGNLTPSEGSDYSPVVYNKPYQHDAFEPAIINYAISALPLAVGYTASIPVFDLNNGSEMFWSNIEVVGQEVVTIDDIKFDCWKVVSDGIRNKTIWIDKGSKLTVKMVTKGNAGAWEIVPDTINFSD